MKHIDDRAAIHAAIETFLHRVSAHAAMWMHMASTYGNPASAIRRTINNDAVCNTLEHRAMLRANNHMDRAVALARRIKRDDSLRRGNALANHHKAHCANAFDHRRAA